MSLEALERKPQTRAELDQALLDATTGCVDMAGGVHAFARDAEERLQVDPAVLSTVYDAVTHLAALSEAFQQARQMLRTFHDDTRAA